MHRINLEGWTLTLAPKEQPDWTHEGLRLHTLDDYASTITVCDIPAKTLLMRSVILAMNETKGIPEYAEECLIGLILQEGYLDQKSFNYRADLSDFLNTLTPRRLPETDTREAICDHLNRKMIANVFHLHNGSYLMRWGSFVNHSCLPNSMISLDRASGEAQFVSLREIQAGEEITICYFSWPINSRQHRNEICRILGFTCVCVLCKNDMPLSILLPLLSQAPSREHCWWCGRRDQKFRCKACDLATYCNKHCAKKDLKEHRHVCKQLKFYHCS